LTLYEIIDDPNIKKIYIITDFIKNGNLAERMSSKDALTLEQVRKYFRDLMSAVDYCHNVANVLHRDIKPENILIGDDDSVKLADFGVSQMIENGDDTLHSKIGTQFFMSPEMFQAASYRGKPADIWACGIVLY
jgi:5'-AMP-activated protein kinase, catalytic alpha subunit